MESAPVPAPSAVRAALGAQDAVLLDHRVRALDYRAINGVTAGLFRIQGRADVRGSERSWSMVVKRLRDPGGPTGGNPGSNARFNEAASDAAHWNYWRREAEVYASSLLSTLPHGLCAPRCYHIDDRGETIDLWLEDLNGTGGDSWPLARYAAFARALGAFNGSFLAGAPLPDARWLSRGILRAWTPPRAQHSVLEDDLLWHRSPLSRHISKAQRSAIHAISERREDLLANVERAPHVVCHLDVWPPNLFALEREPLAAHDGVTALIDWSQTGLGAAGEDIANLVLDSVWMFKIPFETLLAFEQCVTDAYLDGLHVAGWHGSEAEFCCTYAAVAGLRFALLADSFAQAISDPEQCARMCERYKLDLDRLVAQRAAVIAHAAALGSKALHRI